MSSKLTDTGIDTPTFAEIQDATVTSIQTNVTGATDFTISNTQVIGCIINTDTGNVSDLWDTATDTVNAMNPFTASGVNLDYSQLWCSSITRKSAQPTMVFLLLYADTVTDVPIDTSISAGDYTITNEDDFSITNASCAEALYTVSSAIEGDVYSLILDGQEISYTAESGDTTDTIASNLSDLINTETALFYSSADSSTITINKTTNGVVDYSVTFFAEEGSNVALSSFAIYANFYNSVDGAYAIPAGTFDDASTGISGVTCTQPEDGFTGNDEETDQDMRIRGYQSIGLMGATTIGAIQGNLLATNYVQKAVVYTNKTDTAETINGVTIPAHTNYCVVLGGYKVDVANAIYNKIDPAIQTYGSTAVYISATEFPDNSFIMYFDYAEEIAVTITLIATIESSDWYLLSSTAQASIISNIVSAVSTLTMGQTLLMAQLAATVGTVISSGLISVSVSYTIKPYSTSYTDDLIVEANQVVTVQETDITVTILSGSE